MKDDYSNERDVYPVMLCISFSSFQTVPIRAVILLPTLSHLANEIGMCRRISKVAWMER